MPRIRSGASVPFWPTVVVLSTLATAAPVAAQIPDRFTNLKLLVPEISRDELVATMREWSSSLGVRCAHCHVGPDNLQGMDFAADDKPAKRTARQMLEMVRAIHSDHLSTLPVLAAEGRDRAQAVSCATCHRGLAKPPRPIGAELDDAARSGGATAALARFDQLRADHADAGRYDLRPEALFDFGRRLVEQERLDDARAILLELNRRDPADADAHVLRAQVEIFAGHLDVAAAALAAARELDPANRFATWVQGQLDEAKAKAAAAAAEAASPSTPEPGKDP